MGAPVELEMLSSQSFQNPSSFNKRGLGLSAFQYPKARTTSCMAKKKGVRLIITLECVEAKVAGGTPSRYTSQKNKKTHPEKLELMKYNPFLRRHTLHRELK